jgi:hypothetical protein
LAGEASRRGIEFSVAIATTIERSLSVRDIAQVDAIVVSELDDLAGDAVVASLPSGATAVYLRQLAGGARVGIASLTVPVNIPGRLASRLQALGNESAEALIMEGDLEKSLAWERAAVLEGRTITEWALSRTLSVLGR